MGYSHDIIFEPPTGIDITTGKGSISIAGFDKQLVGEVAAKIRSFRKPEPFKGKGIRYKDEHVRRKQYPEQPAAMHRSFFPADEAAK